MKVNNILLYASVGLLLLLPGCSRDNGMQEVLPGDTPVELSGSMTRNDGVNGDNLYIKAFLGDQGGPNPYFGEILFTVPGGLDDTEKDLIFVGAKPYYPLGNLPISLYAFSGKLRGDNMVVKAGYEDEYDAVLSNFGMTDGALSEEGKGTVGSSEVPAEVLHFRHVMTKLTVTIVIDEEEDPPVVAPVNSVEFRMSDIVEQGLYSIRALAPVDNDPDPDVASVDGTGFYTVRNGVNYLVPTGETLSGKTFSYLKIDDYTATPEDRDGFVIGAVENTTGTLDLLPGYAYELEIKLQKLKVTGVTVRLVAWDREELPGEDIDTEGYPLTLTMGQYVNSGDDAITKAVLHTADRLYVGQMAADNSGLKFVRLPQSGSVTSVELYTAKGLLVEAFAVSPTAYTFNNTSGSLSLSVSAGGMVTADGGPYSPTNPYLVATPLHLLNVEKEPTLNYRQAANLDMNTLTLDQAGAIFEGIPLFSGIYDGGGFLISHIEITGRGLFWENNGTLQNIRVFSGTIRSSDNYTGGIAGTNNGTIVACINSAQITNVLDTGGGIAGMNGANGIIVGCLSTGNILQGEVLGGICGENLNPNAHAVNACVSIGMLNGRARVMGGICGRSVTSTNKVFDTAFWLVGSAEHYVGGHETAVGTTGVGIEDCSALDPIELRAIPDPGDPTASAQLPISRLNEALATDYPAWSALYEFVNSYTETGITWPAPMKK